MGFFVCLFLVFGLIFKTGGAFIPVVLGLYYGYYLLIGDRTSV